MAVARPNAYRWDADGIKRTALAWLTLIAKENDSSLKMLTPSPRGRLLPTSLLVTKASAVFGLSLLYCVGQTRLQCLWKERIRVWLRG
jgi:hypothetical protein